MKPFVFAHFLSAFLLFLIEPMYGRRLLPLLGGSAEVWNACMFFYQFVLLAGYAYAYLVADKLRWTLRRQIGCQAILLLIPLALFLSGPPDWSPPTGNNPVPWILAYLLVSAGPAFFVLSTTTPILQRWLVMTQSEQIYDPYFLFSASNLGSMIALVGYPIIFERFSTLTDQFRFWTVGFLLFMVVMAFCARTILRRQVALSEDTSSISAVEPPSWKDRIYWITLAFVPSSLMLSVTAYLTTNISPFPLLWIIPLALYLLTLTIVFARKPLLKLQWFFVLQPVVVISLAVIFYFDPIHFNYPLMFSYHLLAFFATAMVCHGQLAQARPNARYLTEFYLLMALGGALGSFFNALIAPWLCNSVQEYPIVLALSLALRPQTMKLAGWRGKLLDIFLAACVLALMTSLRSLVEQNRINFGIDNNQLFVMGSGAVLASLMCGRPLAMALTVLCILGTAENYWRRDYVYKARNFFGVTEVEHIDKFNFLSNGDILHGCEKIVGPRPHEPLAYYHHGGPIGQFFRVYKDKLAGANVAAVGLGAGCLAAYAQPGQNWTFYEINPQIVRVASDPRSFTYLTDCKAHTNIVIGDGRQGLLKAPSDQYDLIIFDAFSSDAIPIHMLTREAFGLYLSRLRPHGIIAFHISTRSVDLMPILRALSKDQNLSYVMEIEPPVTPEEDAEHKGVSTWAFIARRPFDLAPLKQTPDYHSVPDGPACSVWTDEYSNMIEVIRF